MPGHRTSHQTPAPVAIKRVREAASPADGTRVLVDRLWPRGVAKAQLPLDLWLKDVAPSTELRKWFHHETPRWDEFVRRYRAELAAQPEALRRLDALRRQGPLTLLYDAHDPVHNQAVVLREVLDEGSFLPPPA